MGASASTPSAASAPVTMQHDAAAQLQYSRDPARQSSAPYREESGIGHNGPPSRYGGSTSGSAMPEDSQRSSINATSGGSGSVANLRDSPGARSPASHLLLNRPEPIEGRAATYTLSYNPTSVSRSTRLAPDDVSPSIDEENVAMYVANRSDQNTWVAQAQGAGNTVCLNPASELNSRLDTQVEIKVYPCNNSSHGNGGRKKCTQFIVKPEGVIIQGTNRPPSQDIGTEYSRHIGRKLPRYELSDTRASQLLITSHHKSYYVIPAPEAFSRHSGTCRLLGDRKHNPCNHTLKVGDFLRVGSVGVVVIETHNGTQHESMSEERIQRIMQDTTVGGYVDAEETDLEDSSDVETAGAFLARHAASLPTLPSPTKSNQEYDVPTCYMCFDDEDTEENPLISPCKCKGDTQFVHVDCLRKWHTAEADNQICFLSTVDATCSVCKSTFKSDFRLKSGQLVKLFQSSLEPPYVSLLIATKHEMAQRLFNTRFQLSFKTLMKADGKNATRPLLLGRSSGSDMVLDYRTVSARHATIKFKNGEFIFSDAGSSNGSYLYVRQPVELCPNAPSVQFRLGRSMISMKVVNKWNRRLLRAVTRRSGGHTPTFPLLSQGGNSNNNSDNGDHNPHVNDGIYNSGEKKTRESILKSMPTLGMLDQQSNLHLDLIYALAIPKRELIVKQRDRGSSAERNVESEVPEEAKIAEINCMPEELFPAPSGDMGESSPAIYGSPANRHHSVHSSPSSERGDSVSEIRSARSVDISPLQHSRSNEEPSRRDLSNCMSRSRSHDENVEDINRREYSDETLEDGQQALVVIAHSPEWSNRHSELQIDSINLPSSPDQTPPLVEEGDVHL